MPSRERRGDVRFHVDRRRAGRGPQLRLAVDGEHRRVDARQIRRDHAGSDTREQVEERGREIEIGRPPALLPDDAGSDHHVAGPERGIEPSGDAEAHHRPAAGRHARVEELAEPVRVAAGTHGLDPLPGGHAALAGEAGDGEDRGCGIDHGPLVDQSRKVRKQARTPRGSRGLILRGARLARSRAVAV